MIIITIHQSKMILSIFIPVRARAEKQLTKNDKKILKNMKSYKKFQTTEKSDSNAFLSLKL